VKVSYFETARYVAPQPPPAKWPVPPGVYDRASGVNAYEGMVERLRYVEKLGFRPTNTSATALIRRRRASAPAKAWS
jgi:hypothetical protein